MRFASRPGTGIPVGAAATDVIVLYLYPAGLVDSCPTEIPEVAYHMRYTNPRTTFNNSRAPC
jgi:hypothetical protein